MRLQPLTRALKVVHLLSAAHFGLTIHRLADEIGCGWRTVYRYLEALEAAGFHLEKVGAGKYRLASSPEWLRRPQ